MEVLLEKLPPSNLEQNVQWLRHHIPQEKQCVSVNDSNDQFSRQQHRLPFKLIDNSSQHDGERPFLLCAYNDVGAGHYRSPWTNRLYDWNKFSQGIMDTQNDEIAPDASTTKWRELEVEFNQVWNAYKTLYYGLEAVSSLYLISNEENLSDLEGCFCIQKQSSESASWNSLSVVHAKEVSEGEFEYSIATTVHIVIRNETLTPITKRNESTIMSDKVLVGTTMSKSCCKTCKVQVDKDHIVHVGTMIEANETELRSNLERNIKPKHQETVAAIQKKQTRRPQVNPLMGMMMNSDMLKKRLANLNSKS